MKRIVLLASTIFISTAVFAGHGIFGGHDKTKNTNGVKSIAVELCGTDICPKFRMLEGDCDTDHTYKRYGVCLCEEGYVPKDGVCEPCPTGYYSDGQHECTLCGPGKYSISGSTECGTCAAGTYAPGGTNKCYECPDHANCSNTSFSCKDGFHSIGGSWDTLNCVCNDGTTWSETEEECVTCDSLHRENGTNGSCGDCKTDYYYDEGEGICVENTCTSTNTDNTGCISPATCVKGSITYYTCTECEDGYTLDSVNHKCIANTCDGWTITSTITGCTTEETCQTPTTTYHKCTACSDEYYKRGDTCLNCIEEGYTKTQVCSTESSTYSNGCIEKYPGLVCSGSTPVCNALGTCEACAKANKAGVCVDCLVNYGLGTGACTDLATPVCNTSNKCEACSSGYYNETTHTCTACLVNYGAGTGACTDSTKPVCNSSGTCEACDQYNTSTHECCPSGTFFDSVSSNCVDCLGNYGTGSIGACTDESRPTCNSLGECVECPQYNTASHICCSSGTYFDNDSSCVSCLSNYGTGEIGACQNKNTPECSTTHQCVACTTDYYSETTHSCADCLANYGTGETGACTDITKPVCDSGTCVSCSQYNTVTHSCCEEGYYFNGIDSCVSCLANYGTGWTGACTNSSNPFCNAGICEMCVNGQYNTYTHTCCSESTYFDGEHKCVSCLSNYGVEVTGACEDSTLPVCNGEKECECPTNAICETIPWKCKDGFYKTGNTCTACGANVATCDENGNTLTCLPYHHLYGNYCVADACSSQLDCGGTGSDYYCNITKYTTSGECTDSNKNYYGSDVSGTCQSVSVAGVRTPSENALSYLTFVGFGSGTVSSSGTMNWWSANNFCQALGKELVSIEDLNCYNRGTTKVETGMSIESTMCCKSGEDCHYQGTIYQDRVGYKVFALHTEFCPDPWYNYYWTSSSYGNTSANSCYAFSQYYWDTPARKRQLSGVALCDDGCTTPSEKICSGTPEKDVNGCVKQQLVEVCKGGICNAEGKCVECPNEDGGECTTNVGTSGICKSKKCIATTCSNTIGETCVDNSTVCPGYFCSISLGEYHWMECANFPVTGTVQSLGTPLLANSVDGTKSYLAGPDAHRNTVSMYRDGAESWDAAKNYCEALKTTIEAGVTVNGVDYSQYNPLTRGLASTQGCTTFRYCAKLPNDRWYWLDSLSSSCSAAHVNLDTIGNYGGPPYYNYQTRSQSYNGYGLCE